jgi:branched-chain amino acid transport system ATP-binding protein
MLELKNIKAGYNKKVVLNDVSVTLKDNTITVIMGANGAGKSTLLKTAYGLLKPMAGDILLDGNKITASPQSFVEKGIFCVPQGKRVFRNMTVMENLELATHFWKDRSPFPDRLEEILGHFPDLKERLKDLAGNLSGGQQQMVALARGLINKPRMVFMDEPSIGLAPKLTSDTFHKIKELKDTMGTAFVIVEHNLKTLLPLTDWAYILEQGQIVYDGKSEGKTLEKMLSSVFK